MRTRSASINNRGEQRFGKKYASSHGYRIAGLKLLDPGRADDQPDSRMGWPLSSARRSRVSFE